MIDLHCHILPEIDDGAKTIEESILMAKEAFEDGVHTIVATPHHKNGIYTNSKEDILEFVKALQQRIHSEGLESTILPGSEIHVHETFVEDLKKGALLTFNNKDKYVFLEFPYERVPIGAEQLVFDIQMAGFIPIIPHPERNKDIQNNPNKLYQLVKRGALAQLTAGSLQGLFGRNVQSLSWELIEHELVHMIASDSHGIGKRGIKLSKAYDLIEQNCNSLRVEYFKDNARKVIYGEDIYLGQPRKIERKKSLFSLFSK